MRATMSSAAVLIWMALASGLAAQQSPADPAPALGAQDTPMVIKPLVIELPSTVEGCLALFEAVLQHSLDADLLDDQVDEAEVELENMEGACLEKRFPNALSAAKVIAGILATNK